MFGMSKAERDEDFARFVSESQPSLTGTAWLLCGNREQAADLVQAALVKVYVAWPRARHYRTPVRGRPSSCRTPRGMPTATTKWSGCWTSSLQPSDG